MRWAKGDGVLVVVLMVSHCTAGTSGNSATNGEDSIGGDRNGGRVADAGAADAGTTDAGTTDAGTTDAGTTDAGTTDAGTTDAGTTDAGTTDAGTTDAGTTDAGCSEENLDACAYVGDSRQVSFLDGYTVTDPATTRALPLRVRFPLGVSAAVPVIIWSHGGSFNDTGHRLSGVWGDLLAAAGYAVVHLAHVYPTANAAQALCMASGTPMGECNLTDFNPLTVARPRDVTAVISDLPALSAWLVQQGAPSLDATRVAVCGWSAGSQAPISLAGAVRQVSPSVTRFAQPDARPRAFVGLSPQGPGFSGYFAAGTETSWDTVRAPNLIVTGEGDVKPANPDLLPSIRRQAWDLQPLGGNRFLLWGTQQIGEHGTFNMGQGDLDENAPPASSDHAVLRLQRAVASTVVAFLDAYVRARPDARSYLLSNRAVVLSGGATLTEK